MKKQTYHSWIHSIYIVRFPVFSIMIMYKPLSITKVTYTLLHTHITGAAAVAANCVLRVCDITHTNRGDNYMKNISKQYRK